MRIVLYKKENNKEVKDFILHNLEEIFNSPAKGLNDLDNINKNFQLFLIAKENSKIMGTIGIKKEGNCARISRMYVDRLHRGAGIGKILIKKALEYCKWKFNRVFLTTYERMGSAGFYEKMGFKIFKKEKDIIENCVAYSTFCPQFSNGQLQKQRATSHAVIHIWMEMIFNKKEQQRV